MSTGGSCLLLLLRFRLLFNGLPEHLLRFPDGLRECILLGMVGVPMFHFLPLLGMLNPPVNPLSQGIRVPGREHSLGKEKTLCSSGMSSCPW